MTAGDYLSRMIAAREAHTHPNLLREEELCTDLQCPGNAAVRRLRGRRVMVEGRDPNLPGHVFVRFDSGDDARVPMEWLARMETSDARS